MGKNWKETSYSLTNDYKDGDVTHLGVRQWHQGWVCSSYITVATRFKFCVALASITWGTSGVGSRQGYHVNPKKKDGDED